MIKKKEKNEKKPIEPVPKSIFHLKSVNKLLNFDICTQICKSLKLHGNLQK